MLSRSSSDAALRIRRSKSSSSVHRQARALLQEREDPEVAQRNARIAALHAYEEAYGRASDVAKSSEEVPVRTRTMKNKSSEGSHFLTRRESGKRMRSSTVSKRPSTDAMSSRRDRASSTVDSSTYHQSNTNSMPPRTAPRSAVIHTASEVPTRRVRKAQSSQDFTDHDSSHKQAMLNEYVRSQQRIAYDNHDQTLQSISEYDKPAKSSPGRSFSAFLGQEKVFDPEPQENAEPTEKTVRKRTSFISNPLSRRGRANTHEPIRTTTTSIVTYGNHDHSTTRVQSTSHRPSFDMQEVPKNRTISLSMSLRSRIKRVFRKTSQPTEPEFLPQQQVEATRPHFGDQWDLAPTFGRSSQELDRRAESVLARARSRTPSYTGPTPGTLSSVLPRSREVSGDSQKTAIVTKSRVTSWAESTHAPTVASLNHNKRLSVIDEYGLQVQSPGKVTESVRKPSLAPPITSVLGRKIYDRLMKRQSETEAGPEFYHISEASSREFVHQQASPPLRQPPPPPTLVPEPRTIHVGLPSQQRRVSLLAQMAKEAAKSTIRAVTPDSRRASGKGGQRAGSALFDDHDFSNEDTDIDFLPGDLPSPPKFPSSSTSAPETAMPTAEQVARRVAKSKDRWQGPLETRTTLYSPVSARDYASAGNDKYKSVFADITNTSDPTVNGLNKSKDDAGALFRPVDRGTSRGDTHGAISPSIYSRATDESPEKKHLTESPSPVKRADQGDGTAYILPSYRFSSSGSPQRPQHRPTHSAKSSRDWRAWMHKELSELDAHTDGEVRVAGSTQEYVELAGEKKPGNHEYVRTDGKSTESVAGRTSSTRRSGHVREIAQIDGEEHDVALSLPLPPPLPTHDNSGEFESLLGLYYSDSRRVSGQQQMSTIRKVSASSQGNTITSESASSQGKTVSPEPGNESSKHGARPGHVRRSSSAMNDRFPVIKTGRPPSRASNTRSQSSASYRRPSSAASQQRCASVASTSRRPSANAESMPLHERPKPSIHTDSNNPGTPSNMLTVPENPLLQEPPRRSKSMIPLRTVTHPASLNANLPSIPRIPSRSPNRATLVEQQSTPATSTTTAPTISISTPGVPHAHRGTPSRSSPSKLVLTPHVTPPSPFSAAIGRNSPRRALSTLDLHPAANNAQTGRAASVQSLRRKPISPPQASSLFEDTTVRRIVEGPYGAENAAVIGAAVGKENSRGVEVAGGGGSYASKENRPSPSASPARSLRMRRSLGGLDGTSPGSTGGQKMVDEFLKRRMAGGGVGGVYGAAAQLGTPSKESPGRGSAAAPLAAGWNVKSASGSPLTPGFL